MRPIDNDCAECGHTVALADSHRIIVIYWHTPPRLNGVHIIKRLHDKCSSAWSQNTSTRHDLFPKVDKPS